MKKLILGLFLGCLGRCVFAMDGGIVANPALYPGQVMISYDRLVTNLAISPHSRCSGVVLDKRHVLTTASCVYFLDTSAHPDTFRPVTAQALYVHPSANGSIGDSNSAFPIISPDVQPNIRVISYVLHPRSTDFNDPFFSPPTEKSYNLAILKLAKNIDLPPVTLYHGRNKFRGLAGTALGWDIQERRIQTTPFTFIFKYNFRLNQYQTTILQNPPADAEPCSATLYCTGFSSTNKNLNSSYDKGAPMYRTVNGKRIIIGLAVKATDGISTPKVERYGYINSSAYDFIQQHVPGAKFWSEKGLIPVFENNILPMLQLLLLVD